MDDSRITSIAQLKEFLKASQGMAVSLEDASIEEKYSFIEETVDRLHYHALKKKDKGVVINYLRKITGYRHTQLFRLIKRSEKENWEESLIIELIPTASILPVILNCWKKQTNFTCGCLIWQPKKSC